MIDHVAAIKLSNNRASFYRLLAQLYFQPLSEEQIEVLAAMPLKTLSKNAEPPFVEGYNDLYQALRLRHTGTHEDLAADFTGAFYGIRTLNGRTAQPFESLFQSNTGSLMGEARSTLYHTLKAEALRVPDGIDLPEDHLSFLFEYMARLSDQTASALHTGNNETVHRLVKRQSIFFKDQISSWLSDFITLSEQLIETRFYRGVLRLTQAFANEEPIAMSELEEFLVNQKMCR